VTRVTLAVLTLALCAAVAPAPHVYLLQHSPDGVVLVEAPIEREQTRTFPLDARDGTIAVIVPEADGIPPRVIHPGELSEAIVTSSGGTLSCRVRLTSGGIVEIADVALADLARLDTRLSAIGGDGTRAVFVIHGWSRVERDTVGPAIEPFAPYGRLAPGEWSLYANTFASLDGPAVIGRVPLEVGEQLYANGALERGSSGAWMIDLGAGISLVRRRALPDGQSITANGEHDSTGAPTAPFRFLDVAGVGRAAGLTVLPALSLGSIVVDHTQAAVLDRLPWPGRTLDGVLGIDAIRRGHTVAFDFPRAPGAGGALELGGAPSADPVWARTPMAMMGSFVMIESSIAGHGVHWILDTGSSETILDWRAIRQVGLASGAGDPEAMRGLGGSRLVTIPEVIPELTLGENSVGHVPCRAAALPIFRPFRTPDHSVGLLGLDFLSQFRRIEVDFDRSEVRWFR